MNRKTLVSTFTVMAAIIVAAVLFVAPAAAKAELPLKGTLQAVETANVTPPYNYPTGIGSGHATQLGLFTFSYTGTVFLPTMAGSDFSTEFIAANGDMIYTESDGQGALTDEPGVIAITEWHTITGGTGRFADASGEFTVQRQVNRATGEVSGTFNGAITLANGN